MKEVAKALRDGLPVGLGGDFIHKPRNPTPIKDLGDSSSSTVDNEEFDSGYREKNLDRHADLAGASEMWDEEHLNISDYPDSSVPRVDMLDLHVQGQSILVNSERGSGIPLCPYKHGVPIDSYYYNVVEYITNLTESLMSQEKLEKMRMRFQIQSGIFLRGPRQGDKLSRPSRGWVALFVELFKCDVS